MMKSRVLIGAGLLTLVLAGGAAFAAKEGVRHHRMKFMKHMVSARIEDLEDEIDATPQQRAVIEQSKSNVFAALEAKQAAKAQDQRGQLVALLTADKLDQSALYALVTSKTQDIQDLAKVVVPEIQKVHDVLTPAQRQTLAAKAAQMHEHHRGGFGGPE
ncbi:MAG TPA: Spy/CpxP family protein refolding chaperone [Myxococcales bacterium]|jgi:Spy/CpxP family protein refolding chaperone|nr:Spy/CpxP family protein refolding chaperone [Myxococcales bacterium]